MDPERQVVGTQLRERCRRIISWGIRLQWANANFPPMAKKSQEHLRHNVKIALCLTGGDLDRFRRAIILYSELYVDQVMTDHSPPVIIDGVEADFAGERRKELVYLPAAIEASFQVAQGLVPLTPSEIEETVVAILQNYIPEPGELRSQSAMFKVESEPVATFHSSGSVAEINKNFATFSVCHQPGRSTIITLENPQSIKPSHDWSAPSDIADASMELADVDGLITASGDKKPPHTTGRRTIALSNTTAVPPRFLERSLGEYHRQLALRPELTSWVGFDPELKNRLNQLAPCRSINPDMSLGDTLQSLYELRGYRFVKPQSTSDFAAIADIAALITAAKQTGELLHHPLSISLFTTAAARAIGLAARRVNGSIATIEPPAINGHRWTEIFVPDMDQWLPLDRLYGTFLVYPEEPYYWHDVMLHLSAPLRFSVSYQ